MLIIPYSGIDYSLVCQLEYTSYATWDTARTLILLGPLNLNLDCRDRPDQDPKPMIRI
jgi:hypothetical protein